MLSALLPTIDDFSITRTAMALTVVLVLATIDLLSRLQHRPTHYVFGSVLGTGLAIGILKFTSVLFTPGFEHNAPFLALGVLLLILLWRMLFGPWEAHIKATVLGVFLFWVIMRLLWNESPEDRLAHMIAIGVGVIPAFIWCLLFLEYHRQRLSVVFLMFFTGMLATVPILFYDALVRRNLELQFFFFRIIPESFHENAAAFVSGHAGSSSPVWVTVLTLSMSFLFVGLIEELSKYWVLRRNGEQFFVRIDDVMQMGIIIAVGFAFAENITPSGYFVDFVRKYLLSSTGSDWLSFVSNVLGRSLLTSMVHIVSTGVLGYFLGLAIFAQPYLRDAQLAGKQYRLVNYVHRLLRLDRTSLFQHEMIYVGLLSAFLLHAASNILVTLPDALPGNPRTLGDLLGSPDASWLHYVSLLLLPSMLYLGGGFWLLSRLFDRKENMKERGHVMHNDTFVTTETAL